MCHVRGLVRDNIGLHSTTKYYDSKGGPNRFSIQRRHLGPESRGGGAPKVTCSKVTNSGTGFGHMKMVTEKGIVREGFLNYKTFLKKLFFFNFYF